MKLKEVITFIKTIITQNISEVSIEKKELKIKIKK